MQKKNRWFDEKKHEKTKKKKLHIYELRIVILICENRLVRTISENRSGSQNGNLKKRTKMVLRTCPKNWN